MGMTISDDVKQKLLDKLAEEPPMVISTAYAYAKNYVRYGEDITKAWTTTVQQTSILEQVRQKAWVEAYDFFKKEYENRLKADMVAAFEELRLNIEELDYPKDCDYACNGCLYWGDVDNVIEQKINSLKED